MAFKMYTSGQSSWSSVNGEWERRVGMREKKWVPSEEINEGPEFFFTTFCDGKLLRASDCRRIFDDDCHKGNGKVLPWIFWRCWLLHHRKFIAAQGLSPGYKFCQISKAPAVNHSVNKVVHMHKLDMETVQQLEVSILNQYSKINWLSDADVAFFTGVGDLLVMSMISFGSITRARLSRAQLVSCQRVPCWVSLIHWLINFETSLLLVGCSSKLAGRAGEEGWRQLTRKKD